MRIEGVEWMSLRRCLRSVAIRTMNNVGTIVRIRVEGGQDNERLGEEGVVCRDFAN